MGSWHRLESPQCRALGCEPARHVPPFNSLKVLLMHHLYGISQCDTVKKARQWLQSQGAEFVFHDFKKEPPTPAQCLRWAELLGPQRLINRKGSTWRQLTPDEQANSDTIAGAAAIAQAHPSAIKRPVVEWACGELSVGFDVAAWTQRLQA